MNGGSPWPVNDATREEIAWASRYDGYRRLAATVPELAAVLRPATTEYKATGRVPEWCGVDLLRGWAFFLVRQDHHWGGGALQEEWRAVVEAVRLHPDATADDLPPRRGAPGGTPGIDAGDR